MDRPRVDHSLSGGLQPSNDRSPTKNVGSVVSHRPAAPRLARRATRYAIEAILVASLLAPLSMIASESWSAQVAPHATSTMAGRYVPLNPVRITDTRSGSKLPNAGKTLGNADTLNIQVAGSGGVPSADVSAAVLNVTVVGPTSASALTVFPEGMARPVVVNLNFSASETLANLVTVPLGDGGGVTIFNQAGRADVLVDLEGYYTNSPRSSGLYNQVNPFRVMGSLVAGVTVGPGTSTAVTVAGVGGVPDQVSAVVVNVTVAGSTDPGYLTVFPAPFSGLPSPPPRIEPQLRRWPDDRQSSDRSRRGQRSD